MEAKKTTIKETVSASKKLGEADARDLLKSASKLIVAKGKKLYDKRHVKKKRDWDREKARVLSKNK